MITRHSIQKNRRGARGQNALNPTCPTVIKSLTFQNPKNQIMLDGVESLCEVQLKKNDWPLGSFALMDVFKTPFQTVLNGSTPQKTILIAMDTFQDHTLKTICQKLG